MLIRESKYYVDNTPASTLNLLISEKQNNNNSSVVPKEAAVNSKGVNDYHTVSDNMQIPDNIKLNLYNVDIVYEMTDGVVENKSFSAYWYEIIKMVLLAAILLAVIPGTRAKKTKNETEE